MNIKASDELLGICEEVRSTGLPFVEGDYDDEIDTRLYVYEVLRHLGYAKLVINADGTLSYSHSVDAPLLVVNDEGSTDISLISKSRVELAKIFNPKKSFLDYEIELANNYYESGQIDESMITIKVIDQLKSEDLYEFNSGRYYRLKGIEAFYTGQNQLLPMYFKRAIEKAAKADDHLCVANSYMGLGNYHSWVGELEKAIENYDHALSEYSEIDYKSGTAKVKLNIALAFIKVGKVWEASNSIEDGIELLSFLKNDSLLQYAYFYKAIVMKTVDMYSESIENYQAALDLSMSTENSVLYHLSRVGIVSLNILRKTGKYDLSMVEDARTYFSKSNDVNHLAAIYTVLCEYFIAIQDEVGVEWTLDKLLAIKNENPRLLKNEILGNLLEIFKTLKIHNSSHLLISKTKDKVLAWLHSPEYIKEFNSLSKLFMGDY